MRRSKLKLKCIARTRHFQISRTSHSASRPTPPWMSMIRPMHFFGLGTGYVRCDGHDDACASCGTPCCLHLGRTLFLHKLFQVFPSDPAVVLDQIHGIANPLCCALSADDTLLATGGADSQLIICQWGAALAPIPGAAEIAIQKAVKIECSAPVICTAFSQHAMGKSLPVIAAG